MGNETNFKRRKFMLGIGLGGVGVAAAVVGGRKLMEDTAQGSGVRDKGQRGYRTTEHIQNYYKTARL